MTLSFSGEHSSLTEILLAPDPSAPGGVSPEATSRTNTGLVAQANFAMNDALYVTGGARIERNQAFQVDAQTVVLPITPHASNWNASEPV